MEVIEKAHAKINLGLDVVDKRSDGLHELAMVMTSVDLSDYLTFKTNDSGNITIETENSFLPLDERNHIYQAVEKVRAKYKITQGVNIFLEKNIPVAAGLAGGSSDAAATLRGLNRLWGLNLSLDDLLPLAQAIGTDVPYCLYSKTAIGKGIGTELEFLKPVPQCWVILVKPSVSVSTPKVFNSIEMDQVIHPDITTLLTAINSQNYELMCSKLGNSLEPFTIARCPKVEAIKQSLLKFGVDAAVMSGSGPTVIGLCTNYSRAQRVCNSLKGFCSEVFLVRTLNR